MDIEEIVNLRKELHKHPEVSCEEAHTAKTIINFLKNSHPDDLITQVGGHGVLAVYKGKEDGKNILLRCELDALPIHELNTFAHRSVIAGKGHMCGHDGHMAIIAGVSRVIKEKGIQKGNLYLLFQPAEENGVGAKAVLGDKRFRELKPDYVFALHNLPGYEKNQIVLKRGTFTAAVNSIVIRLTGKTSHAGEPDNGLNPALAMSEIFLEVDKLNNPDKNSDKWRQISYIHASMGEKAYGTSAGDAELGFTFRCWTTSERDRLGEEIMNLAKVIAQKNKIDVEVSFTESFHANENADEAIDLVEKCAKVSNSDIVWQEFPHRFGEDFGIFTEQYTGALFGLGSGKETSSLHNPDYDFPDEIIQKGMDIFYRLVKEVNK